MPIKVVAVVTISKAAAENHSLQSAPYYLVGKLSYYDCAGCRIECPRFCILP